MQTHAEASWEALPQRFRLNGSLKTYIGTPFERDFLVSARLNYLHVFFLLRLASQQHVPSPDESLVDISLAMLSLVVEAVVLRDHLANSGTGLVWKVRVPLHTSVGNTHI